MAYAVLSVLFMRFAKRKSSSAARSERSGRLQIGFVPTIDCASLLIAQELGIFERYDLNVRLSRAVGWATIREMLLHEELDAVAGHASMAVTLYCGLGVIRRPCVSGLLLGANGSAITLSNQLWDQGVRNAADMVRAIQATPGRREFRFGVALDFSTQHLSLRKWLASGGLADSSAVKIIVVPSALVYSAFQQGHIDGYCVAEPWNSTAVLDGVGHVVATSAELLGDHPEKALMVLQDFAEQREDEHLRLIAAIVEAGRYCADPANRREMVRILAKPAYFDVDERYLANALIGPFAAANSACDGASIIDYDPQAHGMPTKARGRWIVDLVRSLRSGPPVPALNTDVSAKIFRQDIFSKALKLGNAHTPAANRRGTKATELSCLLSQAATAA